MSRVMRNTVFGASEQVCTTTEDSRSLKSWIKEVVGLYMYYLFSENKCADQLHVYHAADLCLCFCICKMQIFS